MFAVRNTKNGVQGIEPTFNMLLWKLKKTRKGADREWAL
jgi:hypothetical protein